MLIWGSTCDNGTGWVPGTDTATGKDEAMFLDIRNAFLSNGIAGFTYTKRGCSPEHGGTGDKTVRVTATRENLLKDALAALDALKKRPEIDSNKIFVFGYSEGNTYAWEIGRARKGEIRGLLLTAMIAGRYSIAEYYQKVLRRIEAFDVVDENHDGKITQQEMKLYPCYAEKDYFELSKCDTNADSVLEREELRSCRERRFLEFMKAVENTPAGRFIEDSKDPAEWQRQLYAAKSMVETVDDQNTPVAIFQGQADRATPVHEAITLRDALNQAKKAPFFFKTYPGLSHGLAKGKGRKGHCEKFGPVDDELLKDLVKAVRGKF